MNTRRGAEALRNTHLWWQSLTTVRKAVFVGIVSTALAVLAMAMYNSYSAEVGIRASRQASTRNSHPRGAYQSLLSLPLPGTRHRSEAETAQRLQEVLESFDNIATAQVIVASPLLDSESAPDSPRLSLQLQLVPATAPAANWVENVAAFVLHSVPGLRPADLLIADSSGRLLFDEGRPVSSSGRESPASSAPRRSPDRNDWRWEGWPLAVILGSGCLIVVLFLCALRHRRLAAPEISGQAATALSPEPPVEQPGPLQFLQELSPSRIVGLLAGEGPAVAELALQHLPDEDVVRQVRQHLDCPTAAASRPPRAVRAEVLSSLAAAMQAKLQALEDTAGVEVHVSPRHPTFGGDPLD